MDAYHDDLHEKHEKMTTAPVEKLVLRLAVPTVVIMLITAFYNMTDTFFVGSLGTSAIAGVGVAFPLMAFIQAVGFFFGQGSGIYVARQLGARKTEAASKTAVTGFVMSFVWGAVIGAAGIVFLEEMAVFLGATPTILPDAKDYLFYILLGAPWMTASLTINNLLRFQGSAFYAMIGMSSGALLNILLDPIFIFVLRMGVSGAALATIVSQFVAFCLLWAGCSKGGNIRLRIGNLTRKLEIFREIARGGIPSLIRQSIASIATICINRMAGNYGDAAIAAMSIVTRLAFVANSALLGLGQGFQPVCGFNYGAKLYGRVKKGFWFCVKLSTALMAVMAVAVWIRAPEIIAVFRSDDAEVIAIGSLALRLQFAASILMGWVIMNSMMLQTTGKSLPASTLALARQGLFLLPLLFVLTSAFGLTGIQISQPIADVATFILSIPLNIHMMREMKS